MMVCPNHKPWLKINKEASVNACEYPFVADHVHAVLLNYRPCSEVFSYRYQVCRSRHQILDPSPAMFDNRFLKETLSISISSFLRVYNIELHAVEHIVTNLICIYLEFLKVLDHFRFDF